MVSLTLFTVRGIVFCQIEEEAAERLKEQVWMVRHAQGVRIRVGVEGQGGLKIYCVEPANIYIGIERR